MKVTVYSTTTCPYCTMVKKWLEEKKVEFEEVLVDRDPNRAQEMVQLSGQMGVPFTYVTDDAGKSQGVLGYDVPTLSRVLGVG
ncbi:NrdH-redoxin [Candidatus Saccharibacteria bacterium]|nr:MAG: NrdH-redoxin [Candidatus Saccharibacteria bacterium]